MLSNLANFLLGTQTQTEESEFSIGNVVADVEFQAVDTDDDWVLVEKTEEERDVQAVPSIELAITAIPCSAAIYTCSPHTDRPLTRTSSSSSLPCLSFEESWYVTPPPCFTSEGPIMMESSPLENLLIEHPSISVYQYAHHTTHVPWSNEDQSVESLPVTTIQRTVQPQLQPVATAVPTAVQPQRPPPSSSLQIERVFNSVRLEQKAQQHKVSQFLKRNTLERNNKAREVNSRNKRLRRSDHMLRPSGANNNRKC